MKFLTEIPLQQQSDHQIDYNSNIVLLGSCFVENIGEKLNYFKFQNLQNPFGVLFQPKAIERLVSHALEGKQYDENDVFLYNDIWQCYDAHSKLSAVSKTEVLSRLNTGITKTQTGLKNASHIIITLGTAWAYKHLKEQVYVANCHKVPQKQFSKSLLSVEEIADALKAVMNKIKAVNPGASFIFTVSPIRHVKDGMVENTRSKSHLLTAIHKVLEERKTENCFYFPSFEIMMDELRDYRFYEADLIHPNQIAIDYIWEKFGLTWLASSTKSIMKTVDGIQRGLQHIPFNETSEKHKDFLVKLNKKIAAVKSQFPFIMFNS